MSSTVSQNGSGAGQKGLKKNALGLLGSVVIGTASTAPAYSLAASLGFIVASGGSLLAGVKAPGIMLIAFVPMFLIAIAYKEMNQAEPDCGTTFTWATRAFGSITGWMGGWGIIIADIICMSNLAQIAGAYSFTFVGQITGNQAISDLAKDTTWSTVAGVIWILLMTYICYRGIEVSARMQYALLGIELIILLVFAVYALFRVYTGQAESYSLTPQLDWFNPFTLDFGSIIAPAILTALFIYWGWDTAVSVNEETKDPAKTSGRAAIISTVLLLVTYLLVSTAAVAFAGTGTQGIGLGNPDNSGDVFLAIGPQLFGNSPLGTVFLVLLSASVLTSAAASTQTTILPTARTALSMAAYKAIPTKFASIHKKYLTPSWSTWGMGIISVVFYLVFTMISSSLLLALIGSIGLMIAFYYGLTGFAATWYYRRTIFRSVRNFFMRGLFPTLGGLMLLAAFIYGLQQFLLPDWLTDDNGDNVTIFGLGAVGVVGLMALAVGVVLMVIWWIIKPDFFRGKTLSRRTHILVLDEATGLEKVSVFGAPDAGAERDVIAPDLSNLPTGAVAIDTVTGEKVTRRSLREAENDKK